MTPGPLGTWRLNEAEEIRPLQYGGPFLSYRAYAFDEHLNLYYPVWWKFTADRDGVISVDALETLKPAGAYYVGVIMAVYAGPSHATHTSQLTLVTSDTNYYSPQVLLTTVAGQTYYIVCSLPDSNANPQAYVLRLSDYGLETDWIQEADQVTTSAIHYGDTSGGPYNYPNDEIDFPGYPGNPDASGHITYPNWLENRSGFSGNFGLNRSFGGPGPGDDRDACLCAHRHAVRCDGSDFNWWSKFNGPSWNGTDPYDSGVVGFGNCPAMTVSRVPSSGFGWHVGQRLTSSDWSGPYQEIDYTVWGATFTISLQGLRFGLGPSAGNPEIVTPYIEAAAAQGYSNPVAIFQSYDDPDAPIPRRECTLVKLEFAPDELEDGGWAASPEGDVVTNWYASRSYVDDGYSAFWGPTVWSFSTADEETAFLGSQTVGIQSWLSRSGTHYLTNYSGGRSNFVNIPNIPQFELYEKQINQQVKGELYYQAWLPGITITAFDQAHVNESYPTQFLDDLPPGPGNSHYAVRQFMRPVLRHTATPAPFKITANPITPGLEVNLTLEELAGDIDYVRQAFCVRKPY